MIPLLSSNQSAGPRHDATKSSPNKVSRRQVRPLLASEHASVHQLNTGRSPRDDWGHSRATYRTYVETNPGVATGLDHSGGVAPPPSRRRALRQCIVPGGCSVSVWQEQVEHSAAPPSGQSALTTLTSLPGSARLRGRTRCCTLAVRAPPEVVKKTPIPQARPWPVP